MTRVSIFTAGNREPVVVCDCLPAAFAWMRARNASWIMITKVAEGFQIIVMPLLANVGIATV